ncbi:MAG TPA: flagellar hook-length control protein FliK [Solirubrobacteraceae bacterium]|jgi:hypothetical protein|nr:flagellar hook-length control protein FliK [Solirubrobacteraceae bacterium]
MQPLAVDASLLRAVLATDLQLTVGRALMARVAAITAEGRGTLSIAGMPLDAELPATVQAGDELRLIVREVTPDKVVLAIQDDAQPPPAAFAQAEAPRVPLPNGGSLQVTERDAGGQLATGDGTHTLTLKYDAPTLGPIEMRFTLTPGALNLALEVAPSAYPALDDQAPQLASSLTSAAERPSRVTVTPRREPLEVFA